MVRLLNKSRQRYPVLGSNNHLTAYENDINSFDLTWPERYLDFCYIDRACLLLPMVHSSILVKYKRKTLPYFRTNKTITLKTMAGALHSETLLFDHS